MHPSCMNLVSKFVLDRFTEPDGKKILEVGSTNINGGIRQLFPGSDYTGVDIVAYNGVDIVLQDHYKFPFEDGIFDLAISTNTLEHCTRPWITVQEMARVVKAGGIVLNICPWRFHVHKEGVPAMDCFRILEDGMRSIMEDAGLEVLECQMQEDDTIGVGRKK